MGNLFNESNERYLTSGTLPGDTMMLVFSIRELSYDAMLSSKIHIEQVLRDSSRHWGKSGASSDYDPTTGDLWHVVYFFTDSSETFSVLKLKFPNITLSRIWRSDMKFLYFVNWNT